MVFPANLDTIVVRHKITDAAGHPLKGNTVTAEPAERVWATDGSIVQYRAATQIDANGQWELELPYVDQEGIRNKGVPWRVTEHVPGRPKSYFVAPVLAHGAGPIDAAECLVSAPTSRETVIQAGPVTDEAAASLLAQDGEFKAALMDTIGAETDRIVPGKVAEAIASDDMPAQAAAAAVAQAIADQGDVVDPTVAAAASTPGSATHTYLAGTFAFTKGRPINARDAGVREDVSDISTALNTVIADNPGATIVVPAGATYTLRADNGTPSTGKGGGITLHEANTTLDLRGVTLQMIPSASEHYQLIDVDAPDCRVIGGRLIGDVGSHTGTGGEWGYGISVGANGHRFLADGVYATKFWGDGFFIWERPEDVTFRSCVSDDNRRQGISIIDAIRPRIEGGAYINTGLTASTGPAAGICLEPDPDTARDVIDAVVTGALTTNNLGYGVMSAANGRTLSATYNGVRAVGNGVGFHIAGDGSAVELIGCTAIGNTGVGFFLSSTATDTVLAACVADDNGGRGYQVGTPRAKITGSYARRNGLNGFDVLAAAVDTVLTGTVAEGNSQGTTDAPQYNISAPGTRLLATHSTAGEGAMKPNYGYVVRATATGAVLSGATVSGAFTTSPYLTLAADTVAMPRPGVAPPTLPASGAVTAADIRTALISLGLAK